MGRWEKLLLLLLLLVLLVLLLLLLLVLLLLLLLLWHVVVRLLCSALFMRLHGCGGEELARHGARRGRCPDHGCQPPLPRVPRGQQRCCRRCC